jgi:hypothetical protein
MNIRALVTILIDQQLVVTASLLCGRSRQTLTISTRDRFPGQYLGFLCHLGSTRLRVLESP